jgi:hypothetical protein
MIIVSFQVKCVLPLLVHAIQKAVYTLMNNLNDVSELLNKNTNSSMLRFVILSWDIIDHAKRFSNMFMLKSFHINLANFNVMSDFII